MAGNGGNPQSGQQAQASVNAANPVGAATGTPITPNTYVRPSFGTVAQGGTPVADGVPMVNNGTWLGYGGQIGTGLIGTPEYGQRLAPHGALSPDGVVNTYDSTPQLVPATAWSQNVQKWGMSLNPEDKAKYDAIVEKLKQAHRLPDKGFVSVGSAVEAWNGILLEASYNQQYTPIEYLDIVAATPTVPDPDKKAKAAYTGPTTTTSLTNEFDAKAIVDGALHQYLGRQASEKELAGFYAKLNSIQSANPNVNSPDGKHGRTYTGGVGTAGAGVIADEFAKSRTDYAETQAATTGMRWFEDAIKGMNSDRIL